MEMDEVRYPRIVRSLMIAACAVASFFVINASYSYTHYNLYTDGRWQSSKTQLKKGVVGAWSMMFTRGALKGGKLNLNAWHGHQQLILKDPVPAQKIEFTFTPSNVPFSLILDQSDSISTGIIFYPHGEQKMLFYTADRNCSFISWEYVPLITAATKGKTVIHFSKDSAEIILDDVSQARVPFALPPSIRPGFRGSSDSREIYIDDICITSENKTVFFEDFSSPFTIYKWSWVYFLLWLPPILYCLFRDRLSLFLTTFSCMTLLIVAAVGYYHCRMADRYVDDPSQINWHGVKSAIESAPEVEARLDKEYPVSQIAGKKKVILFVGSSQTWGAGASDTKNTFAAIVQDSLRHAFNDTNIVVINTGISGITTTDMYKRYTEKWYLYKPILTIINASNNDTDIAAFRKNMQAFADYDRTHNIKTLFLEEPNDGIKKPNPKHLIMRSVALAGEIPCMEIQSYLDLWSDDGYLWWDGVHLTDYGQQVFARRILPVIEDKIADGTISLK